MTSELRSIPRTALFLGLAGLLPFFTCAAGVLSPGSWGIFATNASENDFAVRALGGYGAVILSFLGGVRWGNLLNDQARITRWAPWILSVLPSLIAWPALLLPHTSMLLLLATGFILQYALDVTAVRRGEIPNWFGLLRLVLTIGAVLSLLAALATLTIV